MEETVELNEELETLSGDSLEQNELMESSAEAQEQTMEATLDDEPMDYQENSSSGNMHVMIIVVVICAILGLILGIISGKKAAK
jgi:hypothetical protein